MNEKIKNEFQEIKSVVVIVTDLLTGEISSQQYEALPLIQQSELETLTKKIQKFSSDMFYRISDKQKKNIKITSYESNFINNIREGFDNRTFWNIPEKTGYAVVICLPSYIRLLVPELERIINSL